MAEQRLLDQLVLSKNLTYSFYISVPDEIMNLQFDDISDRAVRVSWSPPKKSNGVLIGYKLKYQIKDNPDSFKEEVLPPSNTSIRVEHLQVRQFMLQYYIKLQHDMSYNVC